MTDIPLKTKVTGLFATGLFIIVLFFISLSLSAKPNGTESFTVSSPDKSSHEINILTFNIWDGGDAFGLFTDQRLKGICDLFKRAYQSHRWDIILIQELWPVKERGETLKNCGYPYMGKIDREYDEIEGHLSWATHLIHGDKVDTGLRILSRFPMSEPKRQTYSVNGTGWNLIKGYFSDGEFSFNDGEYFARKSAMLVTIDHPSGPLLVANTHLVSSLRHESYHKQKWLQMEELSKFVEENISRDHIGIIVGGDFNIAPLEDGNEYNERYRNPDYDWDDIMFDLFPDLYHATPLGECTYCYSKNPFAVSEGGVDERVDHILVSHNLLTLKASIIKEEVFLEDRNMHIPLSDHFGVEVKLKYNEKEVKPFLLD